jgi:hypothetical protein
MQGWPLTNETLQCRKETRCIQLRPGRASPCDIATYQDSLVVWPAATPLLEVIAGSMCLSSQCWRCLFPSTQDGSRHPRNRWHCRTRNRKLINAAGRLALTQWRQHGCRRLVFRCRPQALRLLAGFHWGESPQMDDILGDCRDGCHVAHEAGQADRPSSWARAKPGRQREQMTS